MGVGAKPKVALAGRRPFFACPKIRTKRKCSHAALTTPVDALCNRRGKNSLRSSSSPLLPVGEAVARQGGNGLPPRPGLVNI